MSIIPNILSKHQNLLRETLDSYQIHPKSHRILVGISGGPDSVYLAYLLYTLSFEISLAHVNYGLRKLDSKKEEDLVQAYAEKWKVPIYLHRENPKIKMLDSGDSLQQIAREIRYAHYEDLMKKYNIRVCALAHHADDQVESILMSLLKGNSSRVIHGMPAQRGPYIRPMLQFTKQEILEGLANAELEYGYDVSNDSNDYLRNKIRNQVLPLLESINPSIKKQLLIKEKLYTAQKGIMDLKAEKLWKAHEKVYKNGEKEFNWGELKEEIGDSQLEQLLVFGLEKWGWHGNDLWNAVGLFQSSSGKAILGSPGIVNRDRHAIHFTPKDVLDEEHAKIELPAIGKSESEFPMGGWSFHIKEVKQADFTQSDAYYVDADKIKYPYRIRMARQGDKMQPLGMKNNKKLSDIMIDCKWNQREKRQAVVLEDQEKIFMLTNFRIAESVKIDEQTTRIGMIQFEERG